MRSPLQTQRRKGTQEKGSQGPRQSFLASEDQPARWPHKKTAQMIAAYSS